MIDIFGYIGLSLGLFAITKKQMIPFRIWHLASSVSYLIYGVLLSAYPIIISGSLFVGIHLFSLFKITGRSKVKK